MKNIFQVSTNDFEKVTRIKHLTFHCSHYSTNFIIGGRGTDAKVSTLLDLMSKTDPNGTSKRDEFARRLVELGGVHKWTFVYSMVSLALKQSDDEVALFGRSIREHFPGMFAIFFAKYQSLTILVRTRCGTSL